MKRPGSIIINRRDEGVALLFTLAMIVIVALVVVTYATVVRLETTTARSMFELERVNLLSTMALDEVTTKLRDNIPMDAKWAAGPGLLYSYTGASWKKTELHSGASGTATMGTVALNAPTLGDASSSAIISPNSEYPNPDPMRIAWINVLQDGTRSTDANYPAVVPETNPIVGRYAYWVDAETSKVNLNTAGKAQTDYKINSFGPILADADIQNLSGHPSRVDLSKLENITPAESLATYNFAASSLWYGGDGTDNKLGSLQANPTPRTGQGMKMFNSIDDWMQISDSTAGIAITKEKIEANKFYLTTLANTPELTPWGLNKNWWTANRGPRGPVPGYDKTKEPKKNNYWDYSHVGNQLNLANAQSIPPDEYSTANQWGWHSATRYFVYPAIVGKNILNMQHLGWLAEMAYGGDNVANRNPSMQNWIDNVMELLTRKDWPGMPNKSFVDKYGREECESLAVNMLYLYQSTVTAFGPTATIVYRDYPRPSGIDPESDKNGNYGGRLIEYTRSDGTTRLLSGIGAWPYLNEVAVELSTTTSGPTKTDPLTGELIPDPKIKDAGTFSEPGGICANLVADPNYLTYPKINIQIKPTYELTYPKSLAWKNDWVTRDGGGPLGIVGYTNVEVNASGMLNGSLVTYGYDGSPAPQPTWEKPSGETESQYTWGYPDDKHSRGLTFSPASTNSDAQNRTWIVPSSIVQRTLPSFKVGPFDRDSEVEIEVKFRVFSGHGAGSLQIAPTARDYTNSPDDPAHPTKLAFKFAFTPDGISPAPVKSLELCDPRLYRYASDWRPCEEPLGNTLGQPNSVYIASYTDPLTGVTGDSSKLAWPNNGGTFGRANGAGDNDPRLRQTANNITGFPGMGWLSVLPTNIESGGTWFGGVRTPNATGPVPWRTLSLEPARGDQLPDWLLLDIFTIAYEKTFLSHTQGKINVNSEIKPFGFGRLAPLKALMIPIDRVSPATDVDAIAAQLSSYVGTQDIAGSSLPDDMYVYAGQICQVPAMVGSGTNQFAREALMRDVAGLVTTKSGDFKVHLVAQSLIPNKADYSVPGKVAAEQRMEAIVSRVVDVGPDNIPGTADDMAGPDHLVGTADDLTFTAWNGSSITKLKYDGFDPPLEGFAGRPPVRYQVSHLKVLNP